MAQKELFLYRSISGIFSIVLQKMHIRTCRIYFEILLNKMILILVDITINPLTRFIVLKDSDILFHKSHCEKEYACPVVQFIITFSLGFI